MKIHGTAKGGTLSKKDFGVAFGGGAAADIYPDSMGDDGDGTVSGATINTASEILGDGCLSFDGSNDYVTIGSASDWKFLNDGSAWSISFWFNDDDNSHSSRILNTAVMSGAGAGVGFALAHNGDGSLGPYVRNASGGIPFGTDIADAFTDTGAWHNYVLTFDGSSTMKYYKDAGTATTITKSADGFSDSNPTNAQTMGKRVDNTRYLDGLLDDMVIFSGRVISASEVTSLYNSGTGTIASSVFGAGDREGLKVYYNFDELDGSTLTNNATPIE